MSQTHSWEVLWDSFLDYSLLIIEFISVIHKQYVDSFKTHTTDMIASH